MTSCTSENESTQTEIIIQETTETSTRNEGGSCFEDGFVDDQNPNVFFCDPAAYQTINVTFPQYPGCTFVLGIGYTQCIFFNGGSVIYVKNISLVSHNCPAYDNDVIQANQTGNLEQFSLQFDKMMFDAGTDFLGQWAISNGGFSHFVIKFNMAACVQFCYQTNIKDGIEFYTVSRNLCGTGCCAIEKYYYEFNGTIVSDTYNVTEYYEDLEDCNITAPPTCKAISVFGTECAFTCDSFL